jgi:predicted nuclease with TOPRIM domain
LLAAFSTTSINNKRKPEQMATAGIGNRNVEVEKLLAEKAHLHWLTRDQDEQIQYLYKENAELETGMEKVQKKYEKLKSQLALMASTIDGKQMDGTHMKQMIELQLLAEGNFYLPTI